MDMYGAPFSQIAVPVVLPIRNSLIFKFRNSFSYRTHESTTDGSAEESLCYIMEAVVPFCQVSLFFFFF